LIQDEAYHREDILPHVDGDRVLFHGPVGGTKRVTALGKARALLHLINFDEPFGLSVVEAMACGTPVIAMNRGSMPELIDDGRTGFLVPRAEDAIVAVERAAELDRAAIHRAAASRFSVQRMAQDYIALYRRILDGEPIGQRGRAGAQV
jgi:glycosyltransferase involved in cell wall biosynthesis